LPGAFFLRLHHEIPGMQIGVENGYFRISSVRGLSRLFFAMGCRFPENDPPLMLGISQPSGDPLFLSKAF
jgi:hypothetical protein